MNDSKLLRNKIASKVLAMPRSGIRDFFDIVSLRKDVISLGIGEPDFDTPWHIREAAIFALEKGATHYTSNLGMPKLRRAISGYVSKQFQVGYDPDREVLVTVGVSEALDLALRALINPGDEIIYHEPCYVSYRPIIVFAEGVPVVIETKQENNFRVTRAELEEKVTKKTKAIVLNYPNNPTGAVLLRKDVEDIAAFAVKHDLIVITDEIYSELTYDGRHVSIASLPGMRERTIFLHGLSKAWAMTGFRIGYACAPSEMIEAMMKIHQYVMLCAPTPSQEAAAEALLHPDADVQAMHSEYLKRRNFIYNSFRAAGIPCVKPLGAFYAFPYIGDLGLSSKDFAMRLLDEESVAAVPGTAFGNCGAGFLRCAYATSMDDLKEAMARFANFVGRLRAAAPKK